MKKVKIISLLLLVITFACKKPAQQTTEVSTEPKAIVLPTFMDSLSYAYGISIGSDFKKNQIEGMKGKLIGQGIYDLTDTASTLAFSEEEAMAVIQEYSKRLQAQKDKELEERYAVNKQAGIEFLAKNKVREGVITLPNGLQYEIITEGTGSKPIVSDQVKVHYAGYLLNGNIFDSSIQRGQPAQFPLNRVIPGWTQILQLMPVGSKWKVYIPQELAYGKNGGGQAIPPYSALIFDIELLDIVAPSATR